MYKRQVGVEFGIDVCHRIENDVHPLVVVIVVEGKNLVVQNVVEVIAVGDVYKRQGGG